MTWLWPHSIRRDDAERREEEQRQLLALEFRKRAFDKNTEHERILGRRTWPELNRDAQFNGSRHRSEQ